MTLRRPGHRQVRGASPELRQAARQLRINRTPAEMKLWAALRLKQLDGLRFRSQYPVGRFILDFNCGERKLALEVDGEYRRLQVEQDEIRTRCLDDYGYRVLRFTNAEVLENLPDVLARILAAARTSLPVS